MTNREAMPGSRALVLLGVEDDGHLGGDDVMLLRHFRSVNVDSLVSNLLEGFLHGGVDALDVVGVGQLQVDLDGFLLKLKVEKWV